jgi:hypothetical protein
MFLSDGCNVRYAEGGEKCGAVFPLSAVGAIAEPELMEEITPPARRTWWPWAGS